MKQKFKTFAAILVMLLYATTVFAAIPGAYANIAEGDYYLVPEANSGYALDVKGGGAASQQTALQLYNKNGTDAQIFHIRRISGDWYIIQHKRTGYVVNVQWGSFSNGTGLWLYHNDNTASCHWRFIKQNNGSYIIQSQLNSNPIMELQNNNVYPGGRIQLWAKHSGQAGRWKLVSVNTSPNVNSMDGRLKGDVNGDGKVDKSDADILDQYIVGLRSSIPCPKNADLNSDGRHTITDVSMLTRLVNKNVDGQLKGDVNGDGKVDKTDAEILKRYILNPGSGLPCPKNADANGDGQIDIADVTKIVGTYSPTPTPKPIPVIKPLPSYREWQGTAAKRTIAYMDSALTRRNGTEYVDAGDKVTVLKEEGNAYFVRYPVRNGTKERWVAKDIFISVPMSQGLLYPLKGRSIEWSSSAKTNGQRCDYIAPSGTPLYAPADGTVQFRQSYSTSYGKLASYGNNIVFTSSDGQYYVLCAHLSKFNGVQPKYTSSLSYPCGTSRYRCQTIVIATKKDVKKGELLGWTGSTGNASGPHVHIEVKKNGIAVNPKNVFTVWN